MRLVGPAHGTENRSQTVDKTASLLQKCSKVSRLPKMTQIFILKPYVYILLFLVKNLKSLRMF